MRDVEALPAEGPRADPHRDGESRLGGARVKGTGSLIHVISRHVSEQVVDSSAVAPAGVMIEPTFALLFSTRLRGAFSGFGDLPASIAALPSERSEGYVALLAEFELRLLGKAFLEAERMTRWTCGRIALDGLPGDAPAYADVFLLAHKSGCALWEVWLPAPAQPLDAARWVRWLDPDAEDGPVARLWRVLGPVNDQIAGEAGSPGAYFPLSILRSARLPLREIAERHGPDLVQLLFLDSQTRPFKPELVAEELARDYCGREGGMTLLGRRSGLDLHGHEDLTEDAPATGMPPRSALPFLITLELLLLERAILQHLYERLARRMPGSVDELLALKQEVLDALEEYSGAITDATRFSDAVTADGQRLLGLVDLYAAVRDRLDAISFEITTSYQKHITVLQFWLTVVFGAAEIGFIATGIATWYYRTAIGAVLAWTIGAALVAGLVLVLLLRRKVE